MISGFTPWDGACYVRHILRNAKLKRYNYCHVDQLVSTPGASFEWLAAACYFVTSASEGTADKRLFQILETVTSRSGFNTINDNILSELDPKTFALLSSHPLLRVDPPDPMDQMHIWKLHKMLAHLCFWIMKYHLRLNICDVPSSYGDCPERGRGQITPALQYACAKWASHVSFVLNDKQVVRETKVFVSKQSLQWLEIMSLIEMDPASDLNNLMQSIVSRVCQSNGSPLITSVFPFFSGYQAF